MAGHRNDLRHHRQLIQGVDQIHARADIGDHKVRQFLQGKLSCTLDAVGFQNLVKAPFAPGFQQAQSLDHMGLIIN